MSKTEITCAGKRKWKWPSPGYYGWMPFECSGEAYYFYGYANYKPHQRSNPGYCNGYKSSRPQQTSTSKKVYYKEEGKGHLKEIKDKGEKKIKDTYKEKLKNEEFPSLNVKVDQEDTKGSKRVNVKGVWDNPPLWIDKEDLKTAPISIKCHCGNQIDIQLVPRKLSLNVKVDQKDTKGNKQVNGKGVWEIPPMRKGKEDLKTDPSSIKRPGGVQIYAKLVPEKENKPGENLLVNGIDNLEIEEANDSSVLSSSLEAERRLLIEMGWNEADEEKYEITEDDMKEFQNRSKQAQQQRNGLVRTLPKTWSPKHIPVYQADMQELNETLSSSDSDSDDSL